jgi:hypothetical protein
LEERKGQDLRIREPLKGPVALPLRVEDDVGVVEKAEKDDQRLFRWRELSGVVGADIRCSFGRE